MADGREGGPSGLRSVCEFPEAIVEVCVDMIMVVVSVVVVAVRKAVGPNFAIGCAADVTKVIEGLMGRSASLILCVTGAGTRLTGWRGPPLLVRVGASLRFLFASSSA